MTVRLIESLATTEALADVFSDESLLRAMLDFETALARVEARLKIIPRSAAEAIARSAQPGKFDSSVLARAATRAGTPAIPLVKALRALVQKKDQSAAVYVHWGATSQDVCDTALVLLLKQTHASIASAVERLLDALRRLATQHRKTIMLGRTLLQPAPPITMGLKAAGWFAAVQRSRDRIDAAASEAFILQFGGASGTLAALGKSGSEVATGLASELKLRDPLAPWHSHRDRLAWLLCAYGVLSGTVAKIARDISLLMQFEVAEVAETHDSGRGGSSTMPHKNNPTGCVVTLAAAEHLPGLISSYLAGMTQDHERAAGEWQAELSLVARAVQAAGLAAESIAEVVESLSVEPERMRSNLDSTRGEVFAERALFLLSEKIGRERAQHLVAEAVERSRKEKQNLKNVLAEIDEIQSHLDAAVLRDLDNPEQYLGMAEEFQKRLLSSGKRNSSRGTRRRKE